METHHGGFTLRYPSIAALTRVFGPDKARRIRVIMLGDCHVNGETRLQRIDTVLGNCGVEYIPRGHNAKSPSIHYSNTGDSYGVTILKINGQFRIGD